jgi:hypothetical protein
VKIVEATLILDFYPLFQRSFKNYFWMKFCTKSLNLLASKCCEFRGSRCCCSSSHTSLRRQAKFYPHFPCLCPIWQEFGVRYLLTLLLGLREFRGNGREESRTFLTGINELNKYVCALKILWHLYCSSKEIVQLAGAHSTLLCTLLNILKNSQDSTLALR